MGIESLPEINGQVIRGEFKEGKTAKQKLNDFLHLC